MAAAHVTVSLEAELAEAVREAAQADSQDVSAWMTDAARRRLASRGLRDVLAEWEATHGRLSEGELAAARARTEE
ncbi:hypothetical protein [Candidatus Poriferisodalis sp.]|uniref:hypothetical protein n=1 Tax=Candidatus Poriferisodalis sp. TaxID=3101277 RepID=UPI003B024826